MHRNSQIFCACLFLAGGVLAMAAPFPHYAEEISNLIDPRKLAKLEARGANPRVQKYVARLAEARAAGLAPAKVAAEAAALAGMKGEAARLTAEAMVRNLTIAERLGCLDKAGLGEMRQGKAATIRRGPYAGDQLSVDHIIPRAVAPKLDKVIANLELMPLRMNEGKSDRVGTRQVDLARKLRQAGLLSAKGLRAIERKAR